MGIHSAAVSLTVVAFHLMESIMGVCIFLKNALVYICAVFI